MPKRAMPSTLRCVPSRFNSETILETSHSSRGMATRRRGLERFFGIDKDCDRSLIHQLHRHHCLENSASHLNAKVLQRVAKVLIESLRDLWRRRGNITGTALPARVTIQRELRYGQRFALHLEQRAIHFPLIILEYPEIRCLFRHRQRHGSTVFFSHAHKNHQAGADFAGNISVHRNFRPAHPLHHQPHRFPSATAIPVDRSTIYSQHLSPVFAAATPAIAPHYKQTLQAPALPASNRPSAHAPAHPPASDASCRSRQDLARTRIPARLPYQTAHGPSHPRCAVSAP